MLHYNIHTLNTMEITHLNNWHKDVVEDAKGLINIKSVIKLHYYFL